MRTVMTTTMTMTRRVLTMQTVHPLHSLLLLLLLLHPAHRRPRPSLAILLLLHPPPQPKYPRTEEPGDRSRRKARPLSLPLMQAMTVHALRLLPLLLDHHLQDCSDHSLDSAYPLLHHRPLSMFMCRDCLSRPLHTKQSSQRVLSQETPMNSLLPLSASARKK